MTTKPTCGAPHYANTPDAQKFCNRPQNHKGAHWVVIDGTKYFW